MSHELQTVSFAGADLQCARDDDDVFVSVRRVCEGLDVDYSGQLAKLKRTHWATVRHISTVAADGCTRDLAMIDLDTLSMWLATISPSKVSDRARPNVVLYQKECVRVLRGHFFGTVAGDPPQTQRLQERETRYPDGRVVVERFVEEEFAPIERPLLPKPTVPLAVLRKRFHEAMRSELGRDPRHRRLDSEERGYRWNELNSRMKAIVGGITRDEWKHRHYEMAADWLLMSEGVDIRWALAPVQEAHA